MMMWGWPVLVTVVWVLMPALGAAYYWGWESCRPFICGILDVYNWVYMLFCWAVYACVALIGRLPMRRAGHRRAVEMFSNGERSCTGDRRQEGKGTGRLSD